MNFLTIGMIVLLTYFSTFKQYRIGSLIPSSLISMGDVNPIKGDVSDSQLNAGGGPFLPLSGNQ